MRFPEVFVKREARSQEDEDKKSPKLKAQGRECGGLWPFEFVIRSCVCMPFMGASAAVSVRWKVYTIKITLLIRI